MVRSFSLTRFAVLTALLACICLRGFGDDEKPVNPAGDPEEAAATEQDVDATEAPSPATQAEASAPSATSIPSATAAAGTTVAATSKPPVSIDLATLKDEGVQRLDLCSKPFEPDAINSSGEPVKVLAAAFVYFGTSNGQSVFGHEAERFVYCIGNQPYDWLYDYAPLDKDRLDENFAETYGIQLSSLSESLKKNYVESLYLDEIHDVPAKYKDDQLNMNRTVSEAWIRADSKTLYQMLLANTQRYKEQAAKIAHHEELPVYHVLKNDCRIPVKEDLLILNPAYIGKHNPSQLTPGWMWGYVKNHEIEKIIVYPSQRALRILKMKEGGKSTVLEDFVPLSKASPGGMWPHWMVLYPEADQRWKRMLLSPVAGVVNAGAAVAEMAWGLATIPTNFLGRIPHFHFLRFRHRGPDKKYVDLGGLRGEKRVLEGGIDLVSSLTEIAFFRIRYPHATPWTEEEKQLIQDLTQQSVLLEFLETKYLGAPILVEGQP